MTMHNHSHEINITNEKKTQLVIYLTFFAMLFEIIFGYLTKSMALLADGFHMLTHAFALFLAYVAYVLARKFANSDKFKNGTEKIKTLAAYTSSIFLGITGVWIIIEAFIRLINPLQIKFDEAIIVAVIGLFVNGICILIMENKKHKNDNDYNFKAAYYHILADVLTSILAISALLLGKYYNFIYLDSITGILGGVLILKWTIGLIKHTVKILVDMT